MTLVGLGCSAEAVLATHCRSHCVSRCDRGSYSVEQPGHLRRAGGARKRPCVNPRVRSSPHGPHRCHQHDAPVCCSGPGGPVSHRRRCRRLLILCQPCQNFLPCSVRLNLWRCFCGGITALVLWECSACLLLNSSFSKKILLLFCVVLFYAAAILYGLHCRFVEVASYLKPF